MNFSVDAFREPRGVMRILQLIFAIVAFSTTVDYTGKITLTTSSTEAVEYEFPYPFRFEVKNACLSDTVPTHRIAADVSSDAQFFVATGVMSMLYCIFIIGVYGLIDGLYRTKSEFPLADFFLTTILTIFWLSGSAAWANGTQGLKRVTDPDSIQGICKNALKQVHTASFSKLNISLIIGFLNFFLWASDLWFLFKETIWFQGRLEHTNPINSQSNI